MREPTLLDMYMGALISSGYYNRNNFIYDKGIIDMTTEVKRDAELIIAELERRSIAARDADRQRDRRVLVASEAGAPQ